MEEEAYTNEDQITQSGIEESKEQEDSSGKFGIPGEIWEGVDVGLHNLLKKLMSNLEKMMRIETSIGERPNDSEDKSAITTWLQDLLYFLHRDSQEDEIFTRGIDVSLDDEASKLERFKIKPLNSGSGVVVVKEDKKK